MRTTGFFKLAIALASPFLLSPCCCSAEIQPVNKVEEAKWLQWVIPLPREIAIQRKVAISAKQITITLNPEASQLERDAAAELAEVFQQKAGINVPISTGKSVGSGIEILLGTCGKDGRLAARGSGSRAAVEPALSRPGIPHHTAGRPHARPGRHAAPRRVLRGEDPQASPFSRRSARTAIVR